MSFFISESAIPSTAINTGFDPLVVLLSFIIAACASYVALSILLQIAPGDRRSRRRGCILGALVMGIGIWSMHFTGMLAFKMNMVHHYDPAITAVSIVIAAAFSWAVFCTITQERLTWLRIALSAPLMGLAIVSMHYIGMAAMRMQGEIRYIPSLFWLSIAIAIAASGVAMWIMRRVCESRRRRRLWHVLAAFVLGGAVCGMHYTGVMAAVFIPFAGCRFDVNQSHDILIACVIVANIAVILLALFDMARDISSQKLAQERLRLYAVELEAARSEAEQSARLKAEFLANISHELRTPMNGILGMAYLLGDTPLNGQQREYIDTINHSAQNLLLLINDVLDLSKIEASELILEKLPFDIRASFVKTVNLLRPLAINKGIALTCTVDPAVPRDIVGDPGRFAQIVTNLVGNAVKFTEEGKVDAALRYDAPRNSIYCEVSDTGIGIPESKRAAIFEKFVQGDTAITRKYGGTGLGLAITKKLVVMMGGDIGFDSQPGKGSRFWFTLPATLPAAGVAHESDIAVSAHEAKKIDTREARLLVAEDDPVNQLFLIALLKKFGFSHIDVASDGREALEKTGCTDDEKVCHAPYHAIFMDCKMPQQDGYETTRLIRRRERSTERMTHVPIIALTANALAGDREACFEAGMDEYIIKPLQPDRLKDVLKRWFIFPAASELTPAMATHGQGAPVSFDRLHLCAESEQDKQALLALFFRLSDEYIATLERSRRTEEFTRWRNAAHNLKGSAANLGMEALAAACKQAEDALSLSYDQRTTLINRIRAEIEHIRNYIRGFHPTFLPGEI